MDEAAMKILLQVFLWAYIFIYFRKYVDVSASHGTNIVKFTETAVLFSKVIVPVYVSHQDVPYLCQHVVLLVFSILTTLVGV